MFSDVATQAAPAMNSRVLLAADHDVVRLGLKAILAALSTVTVCGEAKDGIDAIRKAHLLKPDIIVVDMGIPRANAVIITRRILEQHPEQKLLILADDEPETIIRDLLRAGIRGLVSKTDPASDILEAVDALQRGRMYFTGAVDNLIFDAYLHPSRSTLEVHDSRPLTLREEEVLQLLAEGMTTKDIAVLLGISVKTAETHRSNIMRELRIHRIPQVILYAVSHRIVEIPVLRIQEAVEIQGILTPIYGCESVPKPVVSSPLPRPSFAVTGVAAGTG